MTITLTPRQTKWLEEQVAAGAFPSVEVAVQEIVEGAMLNTEPSADAIRPLLDEARASLARGEGMDLEEFEGYVDQLLQDLDRR